MKQYILALDQGTTSSRAILFNGHVPVAQAQQEFRQIYPQPGWVEHDPEDIRRSQFSVMRRVIHDSGIGASEIAAWFLINRLLFAKVPALGDWSFIKWKRIREEK